jgi:hypothetical protein
MSREDACEFKARWKFINSYISEEIRNTPPDVKLPQLRTVFNSAPLFQPGESKEVEEVRARWILLKQRLLKNRNPPHKG